MKRVVSIVRRCDLRVAASVHRRLPPFHRADLLERRRHGAIRGADRLVSTARIYGPAIHWSALGPGPQKTFTFPQSAERQTAGTRSSSRRRASPRSGSSRRTTWSRTASCRFPSGTVDFAGVDQVTYTALPTDGVNALDRHRQRRSRTWRPISPGFGVGVPTGPPPPRRASSTTRVSGGTRRRSPESGWGINFAHQGDIIFAHLVHLRHDRPRLVARDDRQQDRPNTYTGKLYETRGPAFNAVPFNPAAGPARPQVGTGTLTFTDANNGSFSLHGQRRSRQTKTHHARRCSGTLPTCTCGAQAEPGARHQLPGPVVGGAGRARSPAGGSTSLTRATRSSPPGSPTTSTARRCGCRRPREDWAGRVHRGALPDHRAGVQRDAVRPRERSTVTKVGTRRSRSPTATTRRSTTRCSSRGPASARHADQGDHAPDLRARPARSATRLSRATLAARRRAAAIRTARRRAPAPTSPPSVTAARAPPPAAAGIGVEARRVILAFRKRASPVPSGRCFARDQRARAHLPAAGDDAPQLEIRHGAGVRGARVRAVGRHDPVDRRAHRGDAVREPRADRLQVGVGVARELAARPCRSRRRRRAPPRRRRAPSCGR